MAVKLPNRAITPIPNTRPAATPSLWNSRYAEMNENFRKLAEFSAVGVCETEASSVEKTVDLTDFVLLNGSSVDVLFTMTNAAANPTLNVNGTGAMPIQYHGEAIEARRLTARHVYRLVYLNSAWHVAGDIDVSDMYLPLSGGTITGALEVQTPTAANHAATKDYVDTKVRQIDFAPYARKDGTDFTGAVIVLEPVSDSNPATKNYVDNAVRSVDLTPYARKDGTAFTGAVTVLEPTADANPSTKAYTDAGDEFGKGVYAAFSLFNEENGILDESASADATAKEGTE